MSGPRGQKEAAQSPQKVALRAKTHSDFMGEGLSSPPSLVSREITREADRR